jgi:hypothetical protein
LASALLAAAIDVVGAPYDKRAAHNEIAISTNAITAVSCAARAQCD